MNVLEVLAGSPRPVSAKFLARQLGCALSTVYNLLAPLTARGHVTRTAAGYVLGPEVPVLYRAFQRQMALGHDSRDLLFRVGAATGAEAYLSAYRDGEIVVLDSTIAPAAPVDPFPVGADGSAHATAHGKVLLASVPRAARRRYLEANGMHRLTASTITDIDRFESEVTRVRRSGVAVSIGEASPEVTCVAVQVAGGSRESAVRALSVSLPTAEYARRHRRITEVLTRAAQEISG